MKFVKELKHRNHILYWFALANLLATLICIIMTQVDSHKMVLGINAWIKPAKFYFSIAIFCTSMGWYLYYLNKPAKTKSYSWMVVIILVFEMLVITWQAANGRMSHFNISKPLYGSLFTAMGVAISILTVWTGYIAYLFFRKKDFSLPDAYIWGIRIGLVLFVLFAFEGGVMAALLRHTIGAKDGQTGWPIVNWAKHFGDLRVAHFFGMHSLQVIPLAGYYLARKKSEIIFFSSLYLIMVAVFLVRALMGFPIL